MGPSAWHHVVKLTCFLNSYISIYSISQYPIVDQDCSKRLTLYSLANMFNGTPFRLLWEAPSDAAIKARRQFVHKYPSLSTTRYSFIKSIAK